MELIKTIFHSIDFENELIAVRAISPDQDPKNVKSQYVRSFEAADAFSKQYRDSYDVYFGVASRLAAKPTEDAVSAGYCVWADLDPYHSEHEDKTECLRAALQSYVLPPSIVVDSGGGYHLYWLLNEKIDIQDEGGWKELRNAGKAIEGTIDGAGNVVDRTRILRVDNTFNHKHGSPTPVAMKKLSPSLTYTLLDIYQAAKLPDNVRRRIVTGDRRGFQSRSERDWRTALAMMEVGLSDDAIRAIFKVHKIGDKYRDKPPKGGDKYFDRTIEKARTSTGTTPEDVRRAEEGFANIFEKDDCWFVMTQRGAQQLSTFVFEPEILLHGENATEEDTLVGKIRASGHTWDNIPLGRGAFVRSDGLIKQLPLAAWQWIGPDSMVKPLLPYLMEQLRSRGLPKRAATERVGYFKGYWLAEEQTLSADGLLDSDTRPVSALPTKRERPIVSYTDEPVDLAVVEEFFTLLPQINEPGVIWPAIGWTAACAYRPRLKEQKIKFPVLNLFGTRGSGKTSLITEVIQPFMGYDDPRTYDCRTTKFIILSLLNSSETIPVAFSEYRKMSKKANDVILRYLLLSYDVGHDPRGRPDQSVQDYPLVAPFTVDGEDAISDSAALERMVQLNMHPETIEETTKAWEVFQDLVTMDLKGIGSQFIMHTLQYEPDWHAAMRLVREAFPQQLPDRVRKNLAVVVYGLLSLEEFAARLGMEVALVFPAVDAEFVKHVLTHCLENLVNIMTGRSLIMVDEFIEEVVNECAMKNGDPWFIQSYDDIQNVWWVHLSTALSWWVQNRKRRDMPTLDIAAIKAQLRERTTRGPNRNSTSGKYVVGRDVRTINHKSYWCYGIDLTIASEIGLDTPTTLTEFRARTKNSSDGKGEKSD